MRGWTRVVAGIAAIATAGTASAHSCWSAAEVEASRVRQMQTMLMVATLRCRAAGTDIIAAYDGFVVAQATALAAANLAIKQHFAAAGGTQTDYDRFATSLANGYGDDETSDGACAEAAALARDATGAGSGSALGTLSAARLFPAALPGGACDAPAAPGAAATPPAAARIVELPQDIVVALGVMARLRDAAPAPAPTAIATAATQMAVLQP